MLLCHSKKSRGWSVAALLDSCLGCCIGPKMKLASADRMRHEEIAGCSRPQSRSRRSCAGTSNSSGALGLSRHTHFHNPEEALASCLPANCSESRKQSSPARHRRQLPRPSRSPISDAGALRSPVGSSRQFPLPLGCCAISHTQRVTGAPPPNVPASAPSGSVLGLSVDLCPRCIWLDPCQLAMIKIIKSRSNNLN